MADKQMNFNPRPEEELDLSVYWFVIRSRLWQILALATVVTILVAILVSAMSPIYKSTAVLLLEPEKANTASMEDLFNIGKRDEAYFNTQSAIIYSGNVLDKVISELHLDTELLAEEEPTTGMMLLLNGSTEDKQRDIEAHQLLLEKVRKNLSIEIVKKTNLMNISYESTSAEQAAMVANALAETYIQDGLDVRAEMTRKATSWMRERMDSLRLELKESEGRLQDFIEAEGLVNLEDGISSLISKELTEQVNHVIAARVKLSELSLRYGEKHPVYIAAQNELAQAERAVESGKAKIRELDRKSVKLKELRHDVESTNQLYETFLNRVKETSESSTLQAATARIIDKATVALEPIKPRKTLIVAASFVVTLLLAIALVFLLNMLDSTIRSVEQVEMKLGVVLLGLLPLLKLKAERSEREAVLKEMTSGSHYLFTESIRTIRTGIMLSAIDNPHKVILVTSSVPSEGKSTVAANLAIAMGKMEKVLLIDADLRRPTVAKNFAMTTKERGLSELVAGTVEVQHCIEHHEEFNIDVMHSGMIPPNPLELIASARFKEILNELEESYDRIIIDSAPLQVVSDSLVMSQYAKGIVYVVKSDSTSEHVIKTCLKRLKQVDAPIIGVVLNQFDARKSGHYGYGYGYGGYNGYYDQYSYTQKESDEN